jgi:hypothetical protein
MNSKPAKVTISSIVMELEEAPLLRRPPRIIQIDPKELSCARWCSALLHRV